MAAIEAEDRLNQVITYNLHKDIADIIEKLSPSDKLMIISANLTSQSVKNKKPYEIIKKLSKWRNSYAHGHCTDRPIKSLRHNHLISPENYKSLPKEIEQMLELVQGYLELSDYLNDISLNEYTKGKLTHNDEILEYLLNVRSF